MAFFFFNDTATTEIYTYLHTLSLHDALPIYANPPNTWMLYRTMPSRAKPRSASSHSLRSATASGTATAEIVGASRLELGGSIRDMGDRKSTRLNSSH